MLALSLVCHQCPGTLGQVHVYVRLVATVVPGTSGTLMFCDFGVAVSKPQPLASSSGSPRL